MNDGSTDATADVVRSRLRDIRGKPRLLLLEHAENRGKGAALRTGLQAATSPLVGYVDADLSIGPGPLAEARMLIAQGADAIVGRRCAMYSDCCSNARSV